jgi:hypothetical protein
MALRLGLVVLKIALHDPTALMEVAGTSPWIRMFGK